MAHFQKKQSNILARDDINLKTHLQIMNKIILIVFFAILTSTQLQAQLDRGNSINVSVGYGISAPYDDVDIMGTGFYAQGEFVLRLKSWFDVRPYAGFILTSPDSDDELQEQLGFEVTANSFLAGGKVRVTAPIPWVAPYIEAGVGLSIGSFKTSTPFTNKEDNGILYHIPFSIGLELGPKRNFDIAFTYYYHPSVEQFVGAAAVGISFPLPN